MAEDDKRDEIPVSDPADEVTQLKKRARRRLIGATALALLAAVVLPMVMDHQPAPPMRDIQVRIPSPDEGPDARPVPKEAPAKPIAQAKVESESKPEAKPDAKPEVKPEAKSEVKPEAKPETKPEPKAESPKPDSKPEIKSEAKAETKPEIKAEAKPKPADKPVENAKSSETWEVQLGAYQEPARVKILVGKLKELGLPTYTEKVDTAGGGRTRVRVGPFPTQDAAEKARQRAKIIGVDGPVAKKP